MVPNIEDITSSDRKIRLQAYSSIFNDRSISNRLELLIKGLNDSHDSVRSNIIDYLSQYYENEKNNSFNFMSVLLNQLQQESFWTVRYLILRKLSQYSFSGLSQHIDELLPFLKNIKPQVRLACAEIVIKYVNTEHNNKKIPEALIECWRLEKDDNNRNAMIRLLNQSENPFIKREIGAYNKKLKEKERKKKEIAGMFEGI